MMHRREKSSPAIVAMKPVNKAARSATEPSVKEPAAAESVEPRAGAKGNADWQSTRRIQRRVSVSQTLERIRQVGSRLLCRRYPRWEPVCGKAASTVLCGGREATRVPTASQVLLRRSGPVLALKRPSTPPSGGPLTAVLPTRNRVN
jgi:hypothetical protein